MRELSREFARLSRELARELFRNFSTVRDVTAPTGRSGGKLSCEEDEKRSCSDDLSTVLSRLSFPLVPLICLETIAFPGELLRDCSLRYAVL